MPNQQRTDVCGICHVELCEICHACRIKHSGPHTKFCVLCLSGEHERTDTPDHR